MTLSFRTMLHATFPALTLLGGLVVGLEEWSLLCAAAIGMMVTGGVFSAEGESAAGTLNWTGVLLTVAAAALTLAKGLYTQFVLQSHPSRIKDGTPTREVVEILRHASIMVCVVAGVSSLFFEPQASAALVGMPEAKRSHFMVLIVSSSVGVLLLSIAEVRLVSLTSALTLASFAVLHNGFFIVAGIIEFNDKFTWRHGVGCALTFLGLGLYTELRRQEHEKRTTLEDVDLAEKELELTDEELE
jgi:drug/metabolite transporter (DMT)-like permease